MARWLKSYCLTSVKKIPEAEKELRWLIFNNSDKTDDLIHSVLSFAESNSLPNTSLRLAPYLKDSEGNLLYESCLYPTPDWTPENGWQVDKALVLSLIRQESRFKEKAKSGSGAMGLMQLMPATASFIAKDRSLRKKGRHKLYNPSYNMYLGQKYIKHLMDERYIKTNLIRVAVGYNAGPGNLIKWEKRLRNPDNDPLFYMEAIRSKETRVYVKRVLTNFWTYRRKFDQNTPSLIALTNDEWPEYISLDDLY